MAFSRAKKRRLSFVALMLFGVAVSVTLFLFAFEENIIFFYSPSDILEQKLDDRYIRIGGVVLADSLTSNEVTESWSFELTDFSHQIKITYSGLLPILFKEGQGAVVLGKFNKDNIFEATEILAKHDENYMPKNIEDKLNKNTDGQSYMKSLKAGIK